LKELSMNLTVNQARSLKDRVEGVLGNFFFFVPLPLAFVALTIVRCVWGDSDLIGWVAILSTISLTAVLWKNVDNYDVIPRTTLVVALAIVSTSSFFWVKSSQGGVWVNTEEKTTTLSRGAISIRPFQSSAYFVPLEQSQSTRVKVVANDGIPLTCNVSALGIVLDKEGEKLEAALTAEPGNPGVRIAKMLGAEIQAATAQAIGPKSSSEIAQLRQFYIPYHVGSRLGNTLASLGLRWNEGRVHLSCEVIFNS
jgi:hypothetical protein